jgi:hypothetical protein
MSTRNRPFLRGWADGSAWMTRKNELSNAQSEWHSTIRLACSNRFHVCVFNNDAYRLVHVSAMPAGLLQADVPEAGGVNLFLRSPSDTGRLGLLARTDCTCVCSATAHLDWWCSSTIGRQSTAAVGWTGVPNDSGKTERFASSEPSQGTGGGELYRVSMAVQRRLSILSGQTRHFENLEERPCPILVPLPESICNGCPAVQTDQAF